MKISENSCFNISIEFIHRDFILDPNNWGIRDFFGSIMMFSEKNTNIITHTGDPAYWYDWKELIEEEIQKDKSILDENNGLTLEQGLVAMQYFLEQKYWNKNNNMLLKDAYEDLVKEYNACADNFESSKLWQEWLIAVAEGKKFNKVFSEAN